MPNKYYFCGEYGRKHGCFQEMSLLDIPAQYRGTKQDLCEYLELKSFDYALPMWWLEDVAKLTGIYVSAYFVWSYAENTYDQPLAITREGETILRIYNYIKGKEQENEKQQLINYLKEKNKLFQAEVNREIPVLTNEKDFEEIRSWSDDQVEKAYITLYCALNGINTATDADLCPWCAIYYKTNKCQNCGYGKRHGICTADQGSTYKIIINHLKANGRKGGFYTFLSNHFEKLQNILTGSKEELENGKS